MADSQGMVLTVWRQFTSIIMAFKEPPSLHLIGGWLANRSPDNKAIIVVVGKKHILWHFIMRYSFGCPVLNNSQLQCGGQFEG